MGMRSRLGALTAIGALVAAVGVAAAQGGATQSKITASFSPNTGGKPAHINFDVMTFSTTGGVPQPGTHAVVHLPKGLKYSANGFTRCNIDLSNPNAGNCPAKSKVGSGSSVVAALVGAAAVNENATVTAYAGPKKNGHDTLLLYAVGTTPISTQITLVGELIPGDKSPYSYKLDVPIPAIPTVPGGPNASITDFKTNIGANAKFHGKKVSLVTAPKKSACVGGKENWLYDGTYQDGSVYSSMTTSACPKK